MILVHLFYTIMFYCCYSDAKRCVIMASTVNDYGLVSRCSLVDLLYFVTSSIAALIIKQCFYKEATNKKCQFHRSTCLIFILIRMIGCYKTLFPIRCCC